MNTESPIVVYQTKWDRKEWNVILELAENKDLPVDNLFKQMLRVYQIIEYRASKGETMMWFDKFGEPIIEHSGCTDCGESE